MFILQVNKLAYLFKPLVAAIKKIASSNADVVKAVQDFVANTGSTFLEKWLPTIITAIFAGLAIWYSAQTARKQNNIRIKDKIFEQLADLFEEKMNLLALLSDDNIKIDDPNIDNSLKCILLSINKRVMFSTGFPITYQLFRTWALDLLKMRSSIEGKYYHILYGKYSRKDGGEYIASYLSYIDHVFQSLARMVPSDFSKMREKEMEQENKSKGFSTENGPEKIKKLYDLHSKLYKLASSSISK